MKNSYEFNIEDIKNASISVKDDITTIWNREVDSDGNHTKKFIETYYAEPEKREDGEIDIICEHCGCWSTLKQSDITDNDHHVCEECQGNYLVSIDENELVDIILSYMNPSEFKNVIIRINHTEIK